MVVVAYVLLAMFGLIGLSFTLKFFTERMNKFEVFVWLLSVVVSALSAGVIWGGLLR
jgi:hypothetical protein